MATYWENSCSFGLRYVSWYKYLIVSLVFSHLGFWSGNLFLIAPFPDLCLLVPFQRRRSLKLWTGDDDGRRTDDGAWPSYKLTLLAFGSGELKMGYAGVNLFFLMFCRKHRLWVLVMH